MTQSTIIAPLAASDLVDTLRVNLIVLGKQTAGLTHEDSLRQPSPRGNCLNFVLGHVALHREYMLQDLGLEPEVGEGALARYAKDSEPILGDSEQVLLLDGLISIINRQQERLLGALETMSDGDLTQPAPLNEKKTVAGHVLFLAWHEGYHLGQTELLRQLAGTDDKVI
jgi:hypothetical protein